MFNCKILHYTKSNFTLYIKENTQLEQKKNGKKFAAIIISSIVIASLLAVVLIQVFYATYDPTKYGRNNGGIDQGDTNTEQVDENENE